MSTEYSQNTYYKEKKNNFTVKKHGRYHLHQVTTSDWTIETAPLDRALKYHYFFLIYLPKKHILTMFNEIHIFFDIHILKDVLFTFCK